MPDLATRLEMPGDPIEGDPGRNSPRILRRRPGTPTEAAELNGILNTRVDRHEGAVTPRSGG